MRSRDVHPAVPSALWAFAMIWAFLFDGPFALAHDIGGVIALPDAPFVIPAPDRTYTFPDYRSDDVLTQRNDNNRSGASYVRGLNQESVRRLKKLAEWKVGNVVTAQPLYISSGPRGPIVVVATSNNDIFAFSPAQTNPSGWLWRRSLGVPFVFPREGNPPPVGFNLGCSPAETAFWEDVKTAENVDRRGRIGIESTPVIDSANNQVLVTYRVKEGNKLAAVNLDTGDVTEIFVPAPAAWHALHRNRASLLLADGVVYVAYAGMCEGDARRFHGAIFAFDAKTHNKVGDFPITNDTTDGGGIWQGSTGIAADDRGNLYFSTGDRRTLVPDELAAAERPTVNCPTFSNSVIRLKTEKIDRNQIPPYLLTMKVADYFTPYRRIWHDAIDLDLGSSGVLLIPRTRYLAAGGKEGIIYVLDRANMGRWDDRDDAWHYEKVLKDKLSKLQKDEPDDRNRDNVHQKFLAAKNGYQNYHKSVDSRSQPGQDGFPALVDVAAYPRHAGLRPFR
jgi:hypothetical protein